MIPVRSVVPSSLGAEAPPTTMKPSAVNTTVTGNSPDAAG